MTDQSRSEGLHATQGSNQDLTFTQPLLSRKKAHQTTSQSAATAKRQAEAYCVHLRVPMLRGAPLGWSGEGHLSNSAHSGMTQLPGHEGG